MNSNVSHQIILRSWSEQLSTLFLLVRFYKKVPIVH